MPSCPSYAPKPLPTLPCLSLLTELHVIEGVPSYIFVKANYAIEVSPGLYGCCQNVSAWCQLASRSDA